VIDAQGRDIGRIFKPRAGAPDDRPWQWSIMGAVVMPRLQSHGFAASLEAKAKFAETWRAWFQLWESLTRQAQIGTPRPRSSPRRLGDHGRGHGRQVLVAFDFFDSTQLAAASDKRGGRDDYQRGNQCPEMTVLLRHREAPSC
jgi:hypothetical protein